jgi:hypothetical protein
VRDSGWRSQSRLRRRLERPGRDARRHRQYFRSTTRRSHRGTRPESLTRRTTSARPAEVAAVEPLPGEPRFPQRTLAEVFAPRLVRPVAHHGPPLGPARPRPAASRSTPHPGRPCMTSPSPRAEDRVPERIRLAASRITGSRGAGPLHDEPRVLVPRIVSRNESSSQHHESPAVGVLGPSRRAPSLRAEDRVS